MYEPGLIRQIVTAENLGRQAALSAFNRFGASKSVFILASAGPTGHIGLVAARLLSNWLPEGSVHVGFLGVDDYATGEVRRVLMATRELPVSLDFLTKEETVSAFVESSANGALIVAASAEDGGYRAEMGEDEAAASPNPNKLFLRPDAGLMLPPPDITVPVPRPDVPALSRDDVRNLDRIAMGKYGISGLSLMENAGWNLARETYVELRARPKTCSVCPRPCEDAGGKEAEAGNSTERVVDAGRRSPPAFAAGRSQDGVSGRTLRAGNLKEPLLIMAGRGNNGGDGLVAARHLRAWNVDCRVVMIGTDKSSTDEALANYELAVDTGVKILPTGPTDISIFVGLLEKAKSVVDAVLGTGLTGRLKGVTADALAILADSNLPVISADIPSGLDADTGEPLGKVPKALVTVTFAASKPGFASAKEFTGEVRVADIGAPWDIVRKLAAAGEKQE
jgi:hydroxyethylthiazole kinase-like uncharacterized protein yjeF